MEAKLLLDSDIAIGDAQMLQVLRLWKSSENATRTNAAPRDAAFVPSDTLGKPAPDLKLSSEREERGCEALSFFQ